MISEPVTSLDLEPRQLTAEAPLRARQSRVSSASRAGGDTVADEFEGERSRRRYERATGPFDGVLDGPVLIYDLNLGGGFIVSSPPPAIGSKLVLKINLLEEGWISVNAETLYHYQHGFAVQFLDLDDDNALRIARTVEALKNRRSFR
jgi:hypothetical protein